MTSRKQSLAAVFGALLVLSATLTGGLGAVGTVQAGGPCDTVDKWVWQVTVGIINDDKCDPVKLSDDIEELGDINAEETKAELHAHAATEAENVETTLTTMGNYLQDTRSIALMEAKNAYIRALNNGSSEATARIAAKNAVADYYAVKQRNLIAKWNGTVSMLAYSHARAVNTTNVGDNFVDVSATSSSVEDGEQRTVSWNATQSIELVNGTGTSVLFIDHQDYLSGYVDEPLEIDGESGGFDRVVVHAPNSNFDDVTVVKIGEFGELWRSIETQNQEVQAEMDTFINQTYDAYQAGEINNTQLIDPYLGSREMGPNADFQDWALASTLALGLDGPENLSKVGKMVVYDNTTDFTYEGILLSGTTPDGGFQFNTTYNASQLNGTQVLITETQRYELTGEFEVRSAVTADGKQLTKNITYRTINYNTTDTEEYQQLLMQVQNLTETLNERRQNLNGGGGGGSGFGGSTTMVIVLVGALVAASVAARGN